jgi:hypothetical protein
LKLTRQFGGIPEPLRRPLKGRLLITKPSRFLLKDGGDMRQQFLLHLSLAGQAGPHGSDGPLNEAF